MARQAIEIDQTGKAVKLWCWIGGAVVGGAGGVVWGNQYSHSNEMDLGLAHIFYGAIGGVGGALIGMVTGWIIYNESYYPKAQTKFDEAYNSFNRYLGGELHLKVNPTFGGASGAVELTY